MGILNRVIKIVSSHLHKNKQQEITQRIPKTMNQTKKNSRSIENDPLAQQINSLKANKSNHQYQKEQSKTKEGVKKPNNLTRKEALSILNIQFEKPTIDQIKSAYKRLLLTNHPDRVQHLSVSDQKIAEQKTVLINLAYSTLL